MGTAGAATAARSGIRNGSDIKAEESERAKARDGKKREVEWKKRRAGKKEAAWLWGALIFFIITLDAGALGVRPMVQTGLQEPALAR